jgi:hypothetical protein
MADFRRNMLLAAMALAIGVGSASAQSIQPGTCAATTGNPPTLRQEGVEELTGAFVIACNTIPSSTVNFDVTLNNGTLPITSRVGEPVVTVNPGDGTPSIEYPGSVVSTNTGSVGANDVRFAGIPITTPNPTITFTGIRTNANVVPTTGGFGQVIALVSVSNGVLPITQPGAGLFVGIVLPALGAVTTTGPTVSACAGVINLAAGTNFTVNIPELFPTAFKSQGPLAGSSPGVNSDSETGPTPFALQATSGTQFAVTFNSVPTGITFYVPQTIYSTAGTAYQAYVAASEGVTTQLQGTDLLGTGVLYITVTTGVPIFYNVALADPSVTETFQIPVYNSAGSLSTSIGTTVTVNLAPLVTDFPIAPNVPVPSTGKVPLFVGGKPATPFATSQVGCQTSLLFPFLTNQAGFDTGFSIAATGTDPFGTGVGGGTCTLYMYGAGAPLTPPTLAIPSSGEGHSTVSTVAPNFQGYAIAVCPFTYAHGYAFISDGFGGPGRGLSEGYVAKVLDYRGNSTASTPIFTPTLPRAESLGN